MKSIQEIFTGDFAEAKTAIVQKMRPDPHNVRARKSNYTEHWPYPTEPFEILVLAIGEDGDNERTLWAGFIEDIQPSDGRKFRLYVDRFRKLGTHDRSAVSDALFYGNGGGGGSRVKITRKAYAGSVRGPGKSVPLGQMEQRLIWVRKNHSKFRDPVWHHWDGRCAVSGSDCDGLLVASHIHPWARSTPIEKTDANNGLLLSVPLDKLFDRGLIGFANDGEMLIKEHLSKRTRDIFGLPKSGARITRMEKVSPEMVQYLARHRKAHGFKK